MNMTVFTDNVADESGNMEESASCDEPVLPVWSYNEETGLWEEEGTAPIEGDRCVESVGHGGCRCDR